MIANANGRPGARRRKGDGNMTDDGVVEPGALYVVSTPIGNIGDLSERAVKCLAGVDVVACEDTRRTGKLLSRIGCKKKLISYNDTNASARCETIVNRLLDSESVALVSDAGTPGVSDPAYRVVLHALENGVPVIPVPGASAVLAALVVSGLPLDRFVFEGFLPQKGAKRLRRIEALADEERTIIIYESPYRVIRLLEEIREIMGDRRISVSRELTKLHEETVRGTVTEVLDCIGAKKTRGEYTVVVRGTGKR